MDNKPIALLLEDAKKAYVTAINEVTNEYNLSYYFLEMILKDIYYETVNAKNIEIENQTQAYKLAVENENKKNADKEDDKK